MNKISVEENFVQILNAISDMVLVKGPSSKLLWANSAFCEYYGMSVSELEGIIDAPFNEPDITQQYVKDDAMVFVTKKILDVPAEPVTRHDGVVRIFNTVKAPIFDSGGNVIMTVGISRDITERKELNKKLKVEYERNVYSSKMASLGEMAGGVAHEINSPLMTLILLAGQCDDVLADANPDIELLKKNILKIDQTSKKIAKIVAGLRCFSRDGNNDPKVNTKMLDIIEDTLSFSRQKLSSAGIQLIVAYGDPDISMCCRATEISQVLLNILNNSQDAIINNANPRWIKLESRLESGSIYLSITDSGVGISREVTEHIFAPFFTTKGIGKGTGLGLSISKKIIEGHGGTLSIDYDCPNTRFVIRLPQSNDDPIVLR